MTNINVTTEVGERDRKRRGRRKVSREGRWGGGGGGGGKVGGEEEEEIKVET